MCTVATARHAGNDECFKQIIWIFCTLWLATKNYLAGTALKLESAESELDPCTIALPDTTVGASRTCSSGALPTHAVRMRLRIEKSKHGIESKSEVSRIDIRSSNDCSMMCRVWKGGNFVTAIALSVVRM